MVGTAQEDLFLLKVGRRECVVASERLFKCLMYTCMHACPDQASKLHHEVAFRFLTAGFVWAFLVFVPVVTRVNTTSVALDCLGQNLYRSISS